MYDKLNAIDQLYAQSLLEKCKGCKGIENCKQEQRGLIPTTDYDTLSNKHRLAFKKCKYARGWTNTNDIIDYDVWNHLQKDNIIKHIKENKNLYLWGEVGLGKTHFLKWLANTLNKRGKNIHFESTFEISRKIKEGFNRHLEVGEESYLQKLQNIDYLFLDDIGNERKTEFNIVDVLWPLIDYRYVHKKPTFISSNYSLKELYDMYAKALNNDYGLKQVRPIISRLKTFGEIELKGRNWRL